MVDISSASILMDDVINAFMVLVPKTSLLLLSLFFNMTSSTCSYRVFIPGREVNGASFLLKAVFS
jgi:hypothetical protein